MVKMIEPPSRENITSNKGYIDMYKLHLGSGIIYVARSWPRPPKHPSKSFTRTHKASTILLNGYRAYPHEYHISIISLFKIFNESPLDYFRYFNQSYCYHFPNLPHIILIEIKNIDVINHTVTFTIKTSSNHPWVIYSQYCKSYIIPGFHKVIRNRYGNFKAYKATRSIPPNKIDPIESVPSLYTFKVPFSSFNIPVCNISFSPAKFQPSSFPLLGFSLAL